MAENTGRPREARAMSLEGDRGTAYDTQGPAMDTEHHPLVSSLSTVPHVRLRNQARQLGRLRNRENVPVSFGDSYEELISEPEYVIVKPENIVEAQRMANNYMFGFKKWKSHVTARPLEERSDVVKELYAAEEKVSQVSTIIPGNILYVIFFGWWLSLVYLILAVLMLLTIFGRHYSIFCIKLAVYFIWPFGKFVHAKLPASNLIQPGENGYPSSLASDTESVATESTPIIQRSIRENALYHRESGFWKRPATYIWLILGVPILFLVHSIAFLTSWFTIVYIPVAKVNMKVIKRILLLPPEAMTIESSSFNEEHQSEIVMYTYHAVNIYYYKYTVDGMNVIAVNLLLFVIIALLCGFLDKESRYVSVEGKFLLALLAIIPLAYYIGMGITSISAQSSYVVGALLNATFGSIVELVLYILSLTRGVKLGTKCYSELVKASLVGSLLAVLMFIPGLCMVIGGIKHSTQNFNPRSAGVSATLLFVSVAGVFAPTIFSKSYGTLHCDKCENTTNMLTLNTTENITHGLQCSDCKSSIFGLDGDPKLYNEHIRPLVYACSIILPVAYIIGLIYSLKTHRAHVYDTFAAETGADEGHGHVVQWGRVKSLVILIVATILMSLCADLVTENIQPILQKSGISVIFIGVTLLALVPDIPEIVNGIQFALQNNISLSIEVGSCIAAQVCMLQIPILVLVDLIYPMQFYLVFLDVELWSVVFGVLMMNYTFQDGKSDYFQGSGLCLVYFALIAMFYFAPTPKDVKC